MDCPEVMRPCCLISEEEVAAAMKGIKIGKVINKIVKEVCIPDASRKSTLMYKGKGNTLVCGSYRAIKLLEQPMKVLERVLEKRVRCQSMEDMQIGFMPGKGGRSGLVDGTNFTS